MRLIYMRYLCHVNLYVNIYVYIAYILFGAGSDGHDFLLDKRPRQAWCALLY